VSLALVIAQTTHGPGMHGGILVTALIVVAVVVGVVALVRKGRRDAQIPSDDPDRDRGPDS
jgi:hypothetical protein